MGSAAYALTTDSPVNWREFPLGERFDSTPQGRRAGVIGRVGKNLSHETEEGYLWQYRLDRRRSWILTFRVHTEAQLLFFLNLHLNVDGAEPWSDVFYFTPDVDESPFQQYEVRKRGNFLPPGIGTPTVDSSGNIVGVFDLTIELLEESEAGQVLA